MEYRVYRFDKIYKVDYVDKFPSKDQFDPQLDESVGDTGAIKHLHNDREEEEKKKREDNKVGTNAGIIIKDGSGPLRLAYQNFKIF